MRRVSNRGLGARACLRMGAAIACAVPLVVAAPAAAAPVAHRVAGALPGFPAARGVVPAASPSALSARERAVNGAFATARSHSAQPSSEPVPNQQLLPACTQKSEEQRSLQTEAVCYRGGPVLHDPTVHLIFWQGPLMTGVPKNSKVSLFTAKYEKVIENYFEGLAAKSGKQSNVFAVDPQYFEEQAGLKVPGEYKLSFNPTNDVIVSEEEFPAHTKAQCPDETKFSEGPCLLDSDMQSAVTKTVESPAGISKGWKDASLKEIYLVITPKGVGSCFEEGGGECAYSVYCAYHGDFGGDGMTAGNQTLYAVLPYVEDVEGCESKVHPVQAQEGTEAAGADGLIDDASHELGETITDPIGSQCDEETGTIKGCEPLSWTDAAGQEIADKCLPPETSVAGIYGEPLGEVIDKEPLSSYNQVIGSHFYWTQRQWSNEAGGYFEKGMFEGACVQQGMSASFTVSANPSATVPVTFDASSSGGEGDPAIYWVWSFGDGEQVGTTNPVVTHAYASSSTANEYEVAVTAYDKGFSSSIGHVQKVTVAPTPASTSTSTTTTSSTASTFSLVTTTTTTTRTVTSAVTSTAPAVTSADVAHFSSTQLATKLGLPRAGAKLSGLGTISLGRAACPPACSLTARLYVKVKSVSHGHHVTKTVLIGSASLTVNRGSTKAIALKLNSAGRSLLHHDHTLGAQLQLMVIGAEGGSWQLSRPYTLTAASVPSRGR